MTTQQLPVASPEEPVDEPAESGPGGRIWMLLRACFTAILITVAALIAWPASHGGPFCLAVVSGVSMQPTYHTGDLVIAAKSSHYSIGDVIVYEVADGDIHGRVIHRIVTQLPDGNFQTRGDNKPYPDPWEVRPGWIYGHAITMIPQGYKAIALLRSPLVLAVICGLFVTIILWPCRKEGGSMWSRAMKT